MPNFEKHFQKDLTDQSQAFSNRSGSPEKLQQLRRAHSFQPEQDRKGKGIVSVEVQEQYNQTKQESWDDNHQAAIREVVRQRGGKTSSDSEISLGYQEGLRGGEGEVTDGNWNTLKNGLNSIGAAFNNNDSENSINTKLNNLRAKLDKYIEKCVGFDYEFLSQIEKKLPRDAKEAAFLLSIKICLDAVESGKRR
jgi:hypothetical protein